MTAMELTEEQRMWWESFYTNHMPYVKSTLRMLGLSADEAEEYSSAALVKGMDWQRRTADIPRTPTAWLIQIAKNLLLTDRRHQGMVNRHAASTVIQESCDSSDQETRYALFIEQVLAPLSSKQRRLFIRYCIEGYTAKDLAREERVDPSSIRSRVHRMLRSVRGMERKAWQI